MDGMRKADSGKHLEDNLRELHERLHQCRTDPSWYHSVHLFFANHMHRFNPVQGSSRSVERLALPQFGFCCDRFLRFQRFHCHWISSILVHSDKHHLNRMEQPFSFRAEKIIYLYLFQKSLGKAKTM
jgi:hypothetical protein